MFEPLLAGEQIFAVLSAASDAKPQEAWRTLVGGTPLQPLWVDTPYATWEAVMPYVGIVEPGSPFLDWVASAEATDWGWLAVSSSSVETVVAHLQSLTKVYLPEGREVFLRFWDGAQLLPILQQCGAEVLPVFQRYLVNGQSLTVETGLVAAAKPGPWWRVPAPLLAHLAEQSPQTLIDNLLQWLEEQRPDLYTAFPASSLRHKVAYFARGPEINHEALADYLASESS
ncbi:DUF4123 domain-containing protein [Pseudomonas poae]|uniref:DUF4123 domain-containing protein n=1 Tax=Pseudomonas poae TaxID=200451 RepID=A0A2S9EYR5_9PSED|nr:DUF4123 domain-containing protein [Pseudomonas poae]PRA30817.1 hypothetical protein CQZ97_09845 [Pseudomonas poae]PRC22333.1 hypothetical protein CQZ99_01945 [Pseudomonas poae]